MKYSIYLIIFILYTLLIFQINNLLILSSLLFFQIILSLILKLKIRELINNILIILPFIIFTILINLIFSNLIDSVLIGYRLLMVSNITYIIGKILTPIILGDAISRLLYPLKVFKIDYKDISLIITIAISFIPILINESRNIKCSLVSKNFKFNLKNLFTRPHIFIITYIRSIFDRIDEVEKTLISKGYN